MAYCKECLAIFPADPNMRECPCCGTLDFKPSRKRYVALKEITEYPFIGEDETEAMIEDTITEVIGNIETECSRGEMHDICWNIIFNTLTMCITSDDYLEVGM